MATKFCTCAASFTDGLGDEEFLEVARADLHKEMPKGDLATRMQANMERCGKEVASGG